jgi:hypothetical protein
MEDRTTPPPAQRHRVTVLRIYRDWQEADFDGAPLPMDEIDRLMVAAASESKRWGHP